jgi:ribosome maturation factor RimP
MTELKRLIEELVEKHLPDENHFIVEVSISDKGGKKLLSILVDADGGMTIRTCSKISRAVSEEIEAKMLMPEAYILEVSSPGVDYPLSSRRQFQKNIDRSLKITLNDGVELLGKLLEVNDSGLKLSVTRKEKGKKAEDVEIQVPFDNMKKSIVQVSFK